MQVTVSNDKRIKMQLDLISPLQDQTWNELIGIAEIKTISKNEKLINKGDLFNYEVFLIKGVIRCYHVTAEAKEYTTSFYKEGEFLSPSFSRQSNGRSSVSIQALEDCEMLLFEEKKFTELRYKFKDLLVLGGRVVENELMLKSTKEVLLATENLKSLYHFFQTSYPGLENRIAQRYIASYIGSDPVSLSRIRSELSKRNDTQSSAFEVSSNF